MGCFRVVLLVLAIVLTSSVVRADPPLPPDQWTAEAQYNLARCWVGEAGWDNETDHAAIGFALVRSWQERRGTSGRTFARQVELYCQALASDRPTARQSWVRELPDGELTVRNRPPTFPTHLSWTGHQGRWQMVRDRVLSWGRGDLADPCPGAVDWGGPMDSIPEYAVHVCTRGEAREVEGSIATLNTFYYADAARRRRALHARIRARERSEQAEAEARREPLTGAIPASIARGTR